MNTSVTEKIPTYELTQEERLEFAAFLRSNNLIETNITPSMEAELASVSVTELAVPTRVGDSRVLLVEPRAAIKGGPLFINIHGGGFVRGYQQRDTLFCAEMANRLRCKILDIDYRLAPEHPFPQGLHECYDVVAWAFKNAGELGVDPEKIALGGHSAGANFSAAICIMANETKEFRVCGQVLDYPFTDGSVSAEEKVAEGGDFFPLSRLQGFLILYTGVPENMLNPLVSPLLASDQQLSDLPPALISIPCHDPLRFEMRRYASRLISLGVDVDVRQYPNSQHGFIVAGKEEYLQARTVIADWLASRF